MRWKQLALALLNAPLRVVGLQALPAWRIQWWKAAARFELWGRSYPCFYHAFNCGWPPYASERCVELALADAWLRDLGPAAEVVEVGAVTPYYWPRRVGRVIDPFDPHPDVTDRCSLFQTDLNGERVLSVSTLEHIGTGEYGSSEGPEQNAAAFRKLFRECRQFLVTVPAGYNPRVDELVFDSGTIPLDVAVSFLVRDGDDGWRQEVEPTRARLPYGDPAVMKQFPGTHIGRWANAVIVLERGGALSAKPPAEEPRPAGSVLHVT
jgi:hypothetical protein